MQKVMKRLWQSSFAKNLISLAIIAIVSIPISLQAGTYNPKVKILDNGLEVIVVEINRAPVASQTLFYKVGGMDDPIGKSGLAHLLEHMMFKGTNNFPDGKFSANVARSGGRDNAYTSQDETAYFQVFPSDKLALMMEMEADRMRNLAFDNPKFQADFLIERQVVIEERAQRTDNNPSARLHEQSNPAFYLNHPYRKPIIGWPGELESLSHEDARAYYNLYYHPNNAILVVTGDVKAEEVFQLAEKFYGGIEKGEIPARYEYGIAKLETKNQITLEDPNVGNAQWLLKYPAPSYGEIREDDPEKYKAQFRKLLALQLAIDMIADGASSPLYKELVINQKIALQAGAGSDLSNRGPSSVYFYLVPHDGIEINQAVTKAKAIIKEIVNSPLDVARLESSKKKMIDQADLALDSITAPARTIGSLRMLGIPLDLIDTLSEQVQSLTMDEAEAALQNLFNQSGQLETFLLPTPAPKG